MMHPGSIDDAQRRRNQIPRTSECELRLTTSGEARSMVVACSLIPVIDAHFLPPPHLFISPDTPFKMSAPVSSKPVTPVAAPVPSEDAIARKVRPRT